MGYIGRQPTNAILTSDDIAAGSVSKDKVNLISDATAGLTVKGDDGSNDGYLQLNCRVNSHGIKLKSPPHSAGATYTLTFPNSVTADKFLKTDGSGNLSFADAGGGKIGQILSTSNNTEFTTTSNSYVDITNLSLAITPSATSSKILVLTTFVGRTSYGGGNSTEAAVKLLRDSTDLQEMSPFIKLSIGNGNPDRLKTSIGHNYLDSPNTTSAITYKYQGKQNTGGTFGVKYINLTLMEVLA